MDGLFDPDCYADDSDPLSRAIYDLKSLHHPTPAILKLPTEIIEKILCYCIKYDPTELYELAKSENDLTLTVKWYSLHKVKLQRYVQSLITFMTAVVPVCKSFQATVQGSIRIQRKLTFCPSIIQPQIPVFNPLLFNGISNSTEPLIPQFALALAWHALQRLEVRPWHDFSSDGWLNQWFRLLYTDASWLKLPLYLGHSDEVLLTLTYFKRTYDGEGWTAANVHYYEIKPNESGRLTMEDVIDFLVKMAQKQKIQKLHKSDCLIPALSDTVELLRRDCFQPFAQEQWEMMSEDPLVQMQWVWGFSIRDWHRGPDRWSPFWSSWFQKL
jgi:hypothetical protein